MPRLEARCPPFLLTAAKILSRISFASETSCSIESFRRSAGELIESSKAIYRVLQCHLTHVPEHPIRGGEVSSISAAGVDARPGTVRSVARKRDMLTFSRVLASASGEYL